MLNGLDLFSGIGGIALALKPWVRTIAYCESDRYAQAVLLSRMLDKQLDRAPIWDDVRSLRGSDLPAIDIITGGFPCQDISVAGTGAGLEGQRSGLFFEIARLISELRPSFIFLENVPAIRTRGADTIGKEMARLGYDCRWTIVSAAEVGAIHIRKRWWLLAHSNSVGLRKEREPEVGWDYSPRSGSLEPKSFGSTRGAFKSSTRTIKPRVVRTGDGLPFNVDRSRCLGNAVVPIQAQAAFRRLMGVE